MLLNCGVGEDSWESLGLGFPKGNQSWLFIWRMMLKLKLQYFGHLVWRTDTFEKTLMLGKIKVGRKRGWQRMRWLDSITDSMDMSLRKSPGVADRQGGLVCWSPWGHKELDMTEQLNWIELKPWTEKPDGQQSMGSWRVGHDQADIHMSYIFNWRQSQIFGCPT